MVNSGNMRFRKGIAATAICTLALAIGALLVPDTAQAPAGEDQAQQVRSDTAVTMQENCAVVQHLSYTRCGHGMTRRQTLPLDLVGKTRQDVQAAYDPFQVTSYAAEEVVMEQALDMYCPRHYVLMPDESGVLCIFQNKYGDAFALVRETQVRLAELPASYQEEIAPGKGFDTLEEVEAWLEVAES